MKTAESCRPFPSLSFERVFLLWLASVMAVGGSVSAQSDRPTAVRFSQVKSHAINQEVELPGTVVPRRVSTVAGEIAGMVVDYPVRVGDWVERGQVVARLRDERLRLEVRAAEAQLAEDQTRLAQAERNLERARELFERNVFSRQQLDDANFEFEALGKRVDRLRAAIEQLEYDIERSVVRAPFAGVIVQELTQVGEWLGEGDGVIELLSINELEIEVPVPERYFSRLNRSRPVAVRFEALPDLRFRAAVASVIPRADPQARTFPVRLAPPRPDSRLGVGMVAQATFTLGGTHEALLVPKDAIVRQGDQEFLYLLAGDDTVRQVEVRSGLGMGAWVEVRGPVTPQDRVVTRGNERLRPGQNVIAEPLEYAFP